MNYILKQIKRLTIKGNYQFTLKAETELESDGLVIENALESILNAEDIDKILNSDHAKTGKKEKLYIIKSVTYDNILIYTKDIIMNKPFGIPKGFRIKAKGSGDSRNPGPYYVAPFGA